MIESLYIAETGMNSQQKLIEVISNNIANASTPGYKQTSVNFVDLVYSPYQTAGTAEQRNTLQNGLGVKVHSTSTNFSAGEYKQTNNAFDIAINGKGFLEVTTEDGTTAYTRAGRLRLDQNGYLATSLGHKLTSSIQIPPDAKGFVITQSGNVLVKLDGEAEMVQLGQIDLVNFNNPDALQSIGQNLYVATDQAGQATYAQAGESGMGNILQGFTEMSNVSMTEEMVNLMLAQRGYQLNARIIQVSDQILETINNLRR